MITNWAGAQRKGASRSDGPAAARTCPGPSPSPATPPGQSRAVADAPPHTPYTPARRARAAAPCLVGWSGALGRAGTSGWCGAQQGTETAVTST